MGGGRRSAEGAERRGAEDGELGGLHGGGRSEFRWKRCWAGWRGVEVNGS